MHPFEKLKSFMTELVAQGASKVELDEAYAQYNREHHALAWAVAQGRIEDVRALLAAGADPDGVDSLGAPALHEAAAAGARELVELSLEAGADIDKTDDYKWTSLIHAANHGHDEIVGLLLARGAKPTLATVEGYTAANRVPGPIGSNVALRRTLQHAESSWTAPAS